LIISTGRKLLLKKNLADYRPGATGSILDEYERAIEELKTVVRNVSGERYTQIADAETQNKDCRSIETIMNHVVVAGHFYIKYIRESLSMETCPVQKKNFSQEEIAGEIDQVIAQTVAIFDGHWDEMNEKMNTVYIDAGWGVRYNIDQMLEHAIVHILRHRRQIEKFILILDGKGQKFRND
jgi:uncharacterized damage-inducible protein DinB